ncbi:MAG: PH domain-containing protein [Verrucomicrobiota bacterium]
MNDVFPMIPAPAKAFWCFASIVVLLLGLLGLFCYLAWSCQHVNFNLTSEGLVIEGDLYGRTVPAKAIVATLAKRIKLPGDSEYLPKVRTNGTALPGYRAGWFTLSNGEKALLYVTDGEKVVYIPTREGYVLMLSVPEPDAFLKALEKKYPES